MNVETLEEVPYDVALLTLTFHQASKRLQRCQDTCGSQFSGSVFLNPGQTILGSIHLGLHLLPVGIVKQDALYPTCPLIHLRAP